MLVRCIMIVAVALLTGCSASPRAAASSRDSASAVLWSRIGVSLLNRDIQAATISRGPLRIYLIGGIHGDEQEGQAALPMLTEIVSAAPLARRATFRIIRDANPDGTTAHSRGNAAGRDLNRNWPAANFIPLKAGGPAPLSEPETAALHRDLTAFAPDLVIVFHSTPRGPFVNYDGPASEQAAAFVGAAKKVDPRWRVVPQMGYATPGSLGSYLGVDRALPVLTIEFKRGQDAESITAAAATGVAAVVSTIHERVRSSRD